MNYTEFTGKTVEEAVETGLTALGLTRENADIRVLEEGKKKLFGSVKARVEIAPISGASAATGEETPTEETEVPVPEKKECKKVCKKQEKAVGKTDGERTVEFLEGLFELLNVKAVTELVSEGEKVEINVTAARTNSIIGKRGVMLDAIQTLAGAVANTGRDDYKRVVVDCEGYRETREETLKKLAENLAQKAMRMGRKIALEPMNPYERRIIHAALSEREGVKTESEGKEPNRYIVVIPDNLEDETAPAISARMERRNDRGRNDRGRGGYNNRGRESRGKSGFGNRQGGQRKFNRSGNQGSSTGGTTMKPSSDFFGIFLGNSGNNTSDEE